MGKRKLHSVESVRQMFGAIHAFKLLANRLDVMHNKRTWQQVTRTSDEQLEIETHQSIGKPLRRYRAKVKVAETFLLFTHEKIKRNEPLTVVDQLRAEQILDELNTVCRAVVVLVSKAIKATKHNSAINQIGFTSPKRKKSVHITGTVSGIDPPTNLATNHRYINLGHVAGLLTRAYSLTAWQLPVRNTA